MMPNHASSTQSNATFLGLEHEDHHCLRARITLLSLHREHFNKPFATLDRQEAHAMDDDDNKDHGEDTGDSDGNPDYSANDDESSQEHAAWSSEDEESEAEGGTDNTCRLQERGMRNKMATDQHKLGVP